jgi:short-subunit dehydrogenase
MKINNKYILITGANRGIGRAFAEACASKGAHLILAMRAHHQDLEIKLKQNGAASVSTVLCDLSTREGVENFTSEIANLKVDILFNNAGLLTGGLVEEQNLDDIYKMFQVNVNSLVHLTRAIIPRMIAQKSGKIINHSSVSAIMHFPCASTYAASKAAVWAFTDCIQREVEGSGVSTLCLFTPGVKTRMFDQIEDLYSKNFEVPKDSISPDLYAQKIIKAIETDLLYLEPEGLTGIGFTMAQNFKTLFNRVVSGKFKRN